MPALADLLPVAAVHVFGNVGPVLCAIFLNKIKDLQRKWHHWWVHMFTSADTWCDVTEYIYLKIVLQCTKRLFYSLFPSDTFWRSCCIFLLHYIYLITLVTFLGISELNVLIDKQKNTNRENKNVKLKSPSNSLSFQIGFEFWIWSPELKKINLGNIRSTSIFQLQLILDPNTFHSFIDFFFYFSYVEQFTAVFECSSTLRVVHRLLQYLSAAVPSGPPL